ncbi:unnamed protein product [Closterium sp. NIES-64]|nr:unnamed protein product [Closterium sp. NIES-64]
MAQPVRVSPACPVRLLLGALRAARPCRAGRITLVRRSPPAFTRFPAPCIPRAHDFCCRSSSFRSPRFSSSPPSPPVASALPDPLPLHRPARLPVLRASASPDPSPAPAEPETAPSPIPVPPPGWAEQQQREAEATAEERDGVTIRRRPPGGAAAHMVGPFQFRVGGKVEENVPRNILEEIVWHKDGEVAAFKERTPLSALARALEGAPPARDFVGALRAREAETGVPALIAEVKKASPSRGVIQPDFDPVRIAKAYEQGGAACLSVLTDSKFFQGSFENLELIRAAGVACPLLCKEFVVDAWQVYCARTKGADAVLLIAAVLPDQDLRYLIKITHSLGMAALIEVHTEREMDRVLALEGVTLIGINNRDLGTFKVDIGNTQQLLAGERGAAIRERGIMVVGESGLFTPHDVAFVQKAGCNAVSAPCNAVSAPCNAVSAPCNAVSAPCNAVSAPCNAVSAPCNAVSAPCNAVSAPCNAVLVGESLVRTSDPTAAIAALFGRPITTHQPGQPEPAQAQSAA